LREMDFESTASTNSATPAIWMKKTGSGTYQASEGSVKVMELVNVRIRYKF